MTGMAIARPRVTGATVFAAMLLMTSGLVIGFSLGQVVAVGDHGGSVPQLAPVGVHTPAQFGGLSPDDREALRSTLQGSSTGFGGLSPDDRQVLRDAGQVGSWPVARFGGLSPDERDDLRTAP